MKEKKYTVEMHIKLFSKYILKSIEPCKLCPAILVTGVNYLNSPCDVCQDFFNDAIKKYYKISRAIKTCPCYAYENAIEITLRAIEEWEAQHK